ncbi:MAG TPA: ABC transporter substrate-binding protein [Gemmatimonadales bacterium]|jgi:peptide/nickel transport system substrate-binding protein
MIRTRLIAAAACGIALTQPVAAQRVANPTVVYAVGAEPAVPLPLFGNNEESNEDVADQLFLHLVVFAPNSHGTADNAFVPSLARAWHRIDPVTLTFDIDPRARWQDGVPVTSRDVIYTWGLANDPTVGLDRSRLDPIASVEAVGERRVRVRFKQPSAEQVYTFGFLMQPLPAHLLEKLSPSAIAASDFARHPIGNGPYRFDHRTPGLAVELHADTAFFLGRPGIARVVVRTTTDATARVNLFLTGETDVLDKIPLPSIPQVTQRAGGRIIALASNRLAYLLINSRSPGDSTQPHPVLGDARVREALAIALDRTTIAHTVFGAASDVPDAAQSQIWSWITGGTIHGAPANPARARALLAQAGWRDANGDGVVERNGTPLRFTLIYAASSAAGNLVALQAQQMWRSIGAEVTLEKLDGGVVGNRVRTGQWDMVFLAANQDPTPSSLVQSWSCKSAHQAGSTNFAHWCDATFDQLVQRALTARDQAAAWRDVLTRMSSQRPAIFIAAPGNPIAVNSRYDNVILWPSHTWLSLWQWRVRPGAALPRDR